MEAAEEIIRVGGIRPHELSQKILSANTYFQIRLKRLRTVTSHRPDMQHPFSGAIAERE